MGLWLLLEAGLFGKHGASHDFCEVYVLQENGYPEDSPAQFTEAHHARLAALGCVLCDDDRTFQADDPTDTKAAKAEARCMTSSRRSSSRTRPERTPTRP